MSVFGGDSWAREAQYRKRRIDDLLAGGIDVSSYKKLASGKYACLVCPHNPVLDTPLMFSMHVKGSRHLAAMSKLTERELQIQDEINKRMALSDSSTKFPRQRGDASKPLIEHAKKAVSEILCRGNSASGINCHGASSQTTAIHETDHANKSGRNVSSHTGKSPAPDKGGEQWTLDVQERRERELKFTAAGWKRDCHGRWFRDENVEFDSDEEDPNVCLA